MADLSADAPIRLDAGAAGEVCAALALALPLCQWGPITLLEKAIPQYVDTARLRGFTPDKFCGYIGGWLSAENKDFQGEVVPVDALDMDYFLYNGYFNDNHSKSTTDDIGFPVLAEVRDHPRVGKAWWTEGPILNTPKGVEMMKHLDVVHSTGMRTAGLSIEGPPPQRDPVDNKRYVRGVVTKASITSQPVNDQMRLAYVQMLKSLDAADPTLSFALADFGRVHPLAAMTIYKALTAGAPTPNLQGGGAALQRESLSSTVAHNAFGGVADGKNAANTQDDKASKDDDKDKDDESRSDRTKKKRRLLTPREAEQEIRKAFPFLSDGAASHVVARIFDSRVG